MLTIIPYIQLCSGDLSEHRKAKNKSVQIGEELILLPLLVNNDCVE